MTRFWSPVVHTLSPYVPGEQPKEDGIVKLNTNENPYGPSPRVLAAIAAATQREELQSRKVTMIMWSSISWNSTATYWVRGRPSLS